MIPKDRDFRGIWIPRAVYLSKEVNWYAKILFLEIHGLTEKGMECYMSNGYMASILNVSQRQVSRYVSELKALGWIEETSFNGRKRYLRSLLRFDDSAVQADTTEATKRIRQFCPGGQDKSVQHNKQVNKPINKQFNSFKERQENIEKRGQVLE